MKDNSMEFMKLEIITPLGIIYNDFIKQVILPGSEGEFTVLLNHSAIVTILDTGLVTIITADNKKISVAIKSGYVKVLEKNIICLIEDAVSVSSQDNNLALSIERAKKLLNKAIINNPYINLAINKLDNIGKK